MTILLDTSILIDHLRGDSRAREVLTHALLPGREPVVASVMTKVEVLAGMGTEEEDPTRQLLALFRWIPVDDVITERAGALANRYLQSHPGVDPVDFVIAATVENLGAELWTRNLKHFPMLSRLRDPYGARGNES